MTITKKHVLWIIPIVLITSCGVFEKDSKGLKDLERIENNFRQVYITATNTPRMTLGTQINALHALQKEISDLEVSDCLKLVKSSVESDIAMASNGLSMYMLGGDMAEKTAKTILSGIFDSDEFNKDIKEECKKDSFW